MFEETAGGIDGRELGAGAQARVDAENPAAAGRSGEQQVAQILREDPDRLVIGALLRLQAQFDLDRGPDRRW